MAWTTPKTWAANDLVTAALMNEQLRDNMNYLFSLVPAGTTVPYAGVVNPPTNPVPYGWLLCDGTAVSRTTYANLFASLGVTYGAGDGSTTFNLPDFRGRLPLGKDNMGGVSANRVVNAQADVLGGNAGAETHTLTVAEMPAHVHSTPAQNGWGNANNFGAGNTTTGTRDTNSTGGGLAHNNMPPYLTVNYIIKT